MAKKEKKKSYAGPIIALLVLGGLLYGSKHHGSVSNAISSVTLSSYQNCVISRESGGNPDVWNRQGYPYWGLYQFGHSTWDESGGPDADWGKSTTSAAEQTQIFDNVMSHYKGCMAWYPSDGCPDPSNGC